MDIGNRIKSARGRRALTQAALAKLIGSEQSTVSGWESDPTRQPSRVMIPKIARALNVTSHYLEFGGEAPSGDAALVDVKDRGLCFDNELLCKCIKMSMENLILPHGLAFSEDQYIRAAEASVTTYKQFLHLRNYHEQNETDAA